MGVSDHDHFTLQNVVDEVNPTTDDLVDGFADAEDIKFDTEYKGSKDNLYNFRNYNNPKIAIIRPYLPHINYKTLYEYSHSWAYARGCGGTWHWFEQNYHKIGVKSVQAGDTIFDIFRTYLVFDLRYLTGTAMEVELRLRITASTGNEWVWVMKGLWTPPLNPASDPCAFSPGPLLSGTHSDYQQGDASYVHKAESISANMTVFNNDAMAHLLTTVLLHTDDFQNNSPEYPENFYRHFYDGANISQSLVWNAELRVKYWGPHFLALYPGEFGNTIELAQSFSGDVRIFISADNQNTWFADVILGDAWLSISAIGGNGMGTGSFKFEATVTANTTESLRSGKIRVYSDAVYNRDVYIDQDCIRLIASPNPWYPTAAGGYQTITVEANPENSWSASVTLGGAWLSISGGGTGTGDGTFQLQADENLGDEREGEVTIDHDGTNYIVEVYQDGAR